MCKAVEDYANQKKIEGIKEGKLEGSIKMIINLLKDGMSLEKALKYAELDRETYEKYTLKQN